MPQSPSITDDQTIHRVWHKRPFTVDISYAFLPQDGSLAFHLNPNSPRWLKIDHKKGLLFGEAPEVAKDKLFKLSIMASNDAGFVLRNICLKVVTTDVVENISEALELILSLRNQLREEPFVPSFLEYIYEYYLQLAEREFFFESLREAAEAVNISLPEKIKFKDFERLMNRIDPNMEASIHAALEVNQILTEYKLTNKEFADLYFQGSQQQGSVPIPQWNHLAKARLGPNWNVLANVMNTATEAVVHLQETKLHQEERQHVAEEHYQATHQTQPGSRKHK